MRLASFNVENLFARAIALNLPTMAAGKKPLELHAEINDILDHDVYSDADKAKIIDLLKALGLEHDDDSGPFAILRQNRGHLVKRPPGADIEVVASGRGDWIGWVELKTQPVDELATRHTAQVIHDVNPDVIGIIEVEGRIALRDFSNILLPDVSGTPFAHVMLIDGNDDRGIDVGIMLRNGYQIESIRSHVDDTDAHGTIFSRDCPEYRVITPLGNRLTILVNHLKSKGFGSQSTSNAKRRRQAQRVAKIYQDLTAAGETNIVVLGDFNDTPDSAPLKPLLKDTNLKDIFTLTGKFVSDGRPGTFGNGAAGDKLDYILLSPTLVDKVTSAGVFRKGVWGGVHGDLFPHFDTITSANEAASDHAAIFVDLNL
jgi:endonuclease/exonuclease/phosphatase family metal-dependent hydrolase